MRNQKGEVVTGVMVVMMVVMMFFVMPFMHGGHKDHGDRHDHGNKEQKQMDRDLGDPESATKSAPTGTK